MSAGKGDKNRVSDFNKYWNSPLWFKGEMTYNKCLFLDNERDPKNAQIFDLGKTLQQVSGIENHRWNIVRSYEEFIEYVNKNGIPDVVSFDNDLMDVCDNTISTETLARSYSMKDWENSPIKTGAHCAAWLCERCKALQTPLPKYYVHSANEFARPIIKAIMESARPLIH
jgi:hypothetical protein